MKLFPVIHSDNLIQVADTFRIDASKSFVIKGQGKIVSLTIDTGEEPIVFDGPSFSLADCFADYSYMSGGVKTITVTAETDTAITESTTRDVTIISSTDDMLWSTDNDLLFFEPEILKWLPKGRTSFKYIHRKAQDLILQWLATVSILLVDDEPVTKEQVIKSEDLKNLSCYIALKVIFEMFSTKTDDYFAQRAKKYDGLSLQIKSSGRIRLDFDKNGLQAINENTNLFVGTYNRR